MGQELLKIQETLKILRLNKCFLLKFKNNNKDKNAFLYN